MTRKTRIVVIIGSCVAFVIAVVVVLATVIGPAFRRISEMRPPEFQEFQPTGQTSQATPCPDPFVFEMPVDASKITSVLYPGQDRGGQFKPHGGFRFDHSRPEDILVTAPSDAEVYMGARYLVGDELQYTFDFAHPCGVHYRLGHLLTLSPKFAALAEGFRPATEGDSRTTSITPPVTVKQGEVIATAVGLSVGDSDFGQNTFVDWGVYDYRQKNTASQDPEWAAAHPNEIEQYAVCLFDWLAPEDRELLLSLPPADSTSGASSAYCT